MGLSTQAAPPLLLLSRYPQLYSEPPTALAWVGARSGWSPGSARRRRRQKPPPPPPPQTSHSALSYRGRQRRREKCPSHFFLLPACFTRSVKGGEEDPAGEGGGERGGGGQRMGEEWREGRGGEGRGGEGKPLSVIPAERKREREERSSDRSYPPPPLSSSLPPSFQHACQANEGRREGTLGEKREGGLSWAIRPFFLSFLSTLSSPTRLPATAGERGQTWTTARRRRRNQTASRAERERELQLFFLLLPLFHTSRGRQDVSEIYKKKSQVGTSPKLRRVDISGKKKCTQSTCPKRYTNVKP